jgi:quercetin dioxygenase-like cupin family protein
MSYKALDADEIKLTWGTFRMVRHELGGTAFGLNQIDFPPGKVGPEHDELPSGQEEVYYCISGSGTLTIDGDRVELRPGRYILVSPDAKRTPEA